MVRGGRSGEAEALAWDKTGPAPDSTTYTNWVKSLIDNLVVVEYEVRTPSMEYNEIGWKQWIQLIHWLFMISCDIVNPYHLFEILSVYDSSFLRHKTGHFLWEIGLLPICLQLLPIINLVKGIPCAATKRRHLTRALVEYLEDFDSCKCAPCPNNARAVLSGTDCQCICQTGTYGPNCEQRAKDYTSGTQQHPLTHWYTHFYTRWGLCIVPVVYCTVIWQCSVCLTDTRHCWMWFDSWWLVHTKQCWMWFGFWSVNTRQVWVWFAVWFPQRQ